jgi:hypothetical protein
MDRRPTLETCPPVLIDAVVRMLIPPACREHVVGDLWERYRSPLGYILDAARTVPFVVASQIRRTSKVSMVFVHAFVFFVAFVAAAGGVRPAIAPAMAGILAFVLRDAYKSGVALSARQVARDVAVAVVFVAISQLLIAVAWPDLLRPRSAVGAIVAFGMVFLIRLQNPGLANHPRQALLAAPGSLEALVTEVRLYERITLRAVRIEMWAGVLIAGAFLIPMWFSPNWALRAGWLLTSAYALNVAYVVPRNKPRRMPEGLGLKESLTFYRAELERKHEALRTMWRWYLLPMVPGMLCILVGSAIVATGRGRPVWPAVVAAVVVGVFGVVVHFGALDTARKLHLRIDALKAAEDA